MPRLLTILVLSLLVAGGHASIAFAQSAGDKANAKAEAERQQQEKAQRKKDKEFNRDISYRHVIGPDVLPLGPFTVSLYVGGQLTEHRVRVALQAVDVTKKAELENAKTQLNGIVYPLCLRLFEKGRPSASDILLFKADVEKHVSNRFKDSLKGVFIESVL
ncbi:MAG: hypothetical protein JJ959_02070 [Nisaea sp.]|jgi:flagellar basal body-associated protein FliL|uniref:hypothetical protein n=1 Tax=Nisaea sp. TaxID=2024842 RepID=UPI001B13DA71|nr:hypothetical protein [Nisaea sp.]MBO6559288.1 hypothetical protein [Nisaea sp.]